MGSAEQVCEIDVAHGIEVAPVKAIQVEVDVASLSHETRDVIAGAQFPER